MQEYEQEVENLEQELSLSREKDGVYLSSHKALDSIKLLYFSLFYPLVLFSSPSLTLLISISLFIPSNLLSKFMSSLTL